MAAGNEKEFIKNHITAEVFNDINYSHHIKRQQDLESLKTAASHFKQFKDNGCNAAMLTRSTGRHDNGRGCEYLQWLGIKGTPAQVAASFRWQAITAEIDCLMDLDSDTGQQYPFNKNASLIPEAFALAIDEQPIACQDVSEAQHRAIYGRWSLMNYKRGNVWHLGGDDTVGDPVPTPMP